MNDHEKAGLYDKLVENAKLVYDYGNLNHWEITIPSIKKQTFLEAVRALKNPPPAD